MSNEKGDIRDSDPVSTTVALFVFLFLIFCGWGLNALFHYYPVDLWCYYDVQSPYDAKESSKFCDAFVVCCPHSERFNASTVKALVASTGKPVIIMVFPLRTFTFSNSTISQICTRLRNSDTVQMLLETSGVVVSAFNLVEQTDICWKEIQHLIKTIEDSKAWWSKRFRKVLLVETKYNGKTLSTGEVKMIKFESKAPQQFFNTLLIMSHQEGVDRQREPCVNNYDHINTAVNQTRHWFKNDIAVVFSVGELFLGSSNSSNSQSSSLVLLEHSDREEYLEVYSNLCPHPTPLEHNGTCLILTRSGLPNGTVQTSVTNPQTFDHLSVDGVKIVLAVDVDIDGRAMKCKETCKGGPCASFPKLGTFRAHVAYCQLCWRDSWKNWNANGKL